MTIQLSLSLGTPPAPVQDPKQLHFKDTFQETI